MKLQAWINQQIKSNPDWIAEKVVTETNGNGEYRLQFKGAAVSEVAERFDALEFGGGLRERVLDAIPNDGGEAPAQIPQGIRVIYMAAPFGDEFGI